ncbi:UNVERIFIED_ORG: hypothetical protein ABIB63_000117 [Xanthomonas axonopodis]
MGSKTHLAMSPVGHIARSLQPAAPNKPGNALRDAVGCIFDVGQIQRRVSERSRNHQGDFLPRAASVIDKCVDCAFNVGWASACRRQSPFQMPGAQP